ncbi:MAG TPA: flagellar type III secretion system pore protein FliP [Rickettsiales bacterium]|nr:flagellar type III secretion system pore protein FliP [Rickettsiales bacterium]
MTRQHKKNLLSWGMVFTGLFALVLFMLPVDAMAQKLTLDLGNNAGAIGDGDSSVTSRLIELVVLMTIIPLAPSIIMMVTSFTRIIIVLSLLRTALGLQQTPPNQVLISLALFLTFFIMSPVLQKAYTDGIEPLVNGQISERDAIEKTSAPFHDFMMRNVREKDLRLFIDMSPGIKIATPADTPYRILIPAFMIGELKRAFEIGFLVYLPFLIIDMLVASTLMAMGMMMLPPVLISLPFKLIFFVIVDGWYSLSGSLVRSFGM